MEVNEVLRAAKRGHKYVKKRKKRARKEIKEEVADLLDKAKKEFYEYLKKYFGENDEDT